MAEEQLYTVEGAKATPAERVSLTEAGLLERQHLQEWVIAIQRSWARTFSSSPSSSTVGSPAPARRRGSGSTCWPLIALAGSSSLS